MLVAKHHDIDIKETLKREIKASLISELVEMEILPEADEGASGSASLTFEQQKELLSLKHTFEVEKERMKQEGEGSI